VVVLGIYFVSKGAAMPILRIRNEFGKQDAVRCLLLSDAGGYRIPASCTDLTLCPAPYTYSPLLLIRLCWPV
jgi:hypothetical protein